MFAFFQDILDQHAPIQICGFSIKQNKKVINHGYPRNLKIISQKNHLYNQCKFSQSYDVFKEFKKCSKIVNRKPRDAHHKYSVDFFKQIETEMEFHQ